MQKLIQLRKIQLKRMLYDMGNLSVFISIAYLLLLIFMFFVIRDKSTTLSIFIGLIFLLITLHNSRKDKAFLVSHFENAINIYRIEYFILLVPILFVSLIAFNLQLILYSIISLFFIPYVNTYSKTFQGNYFINFIPTMLYEWKSGLRKTYLFPFVLYLIAYPSAYVKFLPIVVLFFCSTNIATFYDENEDVLLLERFGSSANEIFYKKIFMATKMMITLFAPVLLLSSIIHPNNALLNGLFLINQIVLIIFILTVKYKHYMPMYNPIKNSNFTATFILLSALPGFFFVPLIYVLAYHKQAINKINQFI